MSDAPSPDPAAVPAAALAPAEKVKQFPAAPGVYLMKDSQGRVLYVGKAKNLRHQQHQQHEEIPVADEEGFHEGRKAWTVHREPFGFRTDHGPRSTVHCTNQF